jgi:hypothetical protein
MLKCLHIVGGPFFQPSFYPGDATQSVCSSVKQKAWLKYRKIVGLWRRIGVVKHHSNFIELSAVEVFRFG